VRLWAESCRRSSVRFRALLACSLRTQGSRCESGPGLSDRPTGTTTLGFSTGAARRVISQCRPTSTSLCPFSGRWLLHSPWLALQRSHTLPSTYVCIASYLSTASMHAGASCGRGLCWTRTQTHASPRLAHAASHLLLHSSSRADHRLAYK
jgi:hypothetical protein